MPAISLTAPPEAFACGICEHADLAKKAGPGCIGCPAFTGVHYFPYGEGDEACDVLFVGDVPEKPYKPKTSWTDSAAYHRSYDDDVGRVLKAASRELLSRDMFQALKCRYVYAVKCAISTPNRKVISSCRTPLLEDFKQIQTTRQRMGLTHKLVVVACGIRSLQALGISVRSDADAQGRVFEAMFGGYPITVVVTRSLKAIVTETGKYSSLVSDIERAFRYAIDEAIPVKTKDSLEKNYIFPKTNQEVEDLCEMMANYSLYGVAPGSWSMAMDTETNTLFPHRKELIVTCISFSWDHGKSAAIPLWHPIITDKDKAKTEEELEKVKKELFVDWSYDPVKAWATVRRFIERLYPIPDPQDPTKTILQRKKFIFHNYKYDVKVLWKLGLPFDATNYAWDVMSGEHVLEEDKKRQYNLKYLTRQYIPEYAGYEDQVRDLLEQQDLERIREEDEENKSAEKIVKTPAAVLAALQRLIALKLIKTDRFQVAALEKKVKDLLDKDPQALTADQQTDARMVCAAKKNKEFQKRVIKSERKIVSGGYEKVPLKDLCFYAAVDTDVTRQLAIMQLKRMAREDVALEESRKFQEEHGRNNQFDVQRLCNEKAPLRSLVQNHYLPRSKELADIEFKGIRIDRDYIRDGRVDLERTIRVTEEQIYKLCGERINIRSTKQLGHYIFNTGYGFLHPDPEHAAQIASDNPENVSWDGKRLSYKPQHYTERGYIQTGSAVRQYLVARYECPLSNLLLSHSKAEKALNSFFNNIDRLAEHGYGWIHPGYNLNGTGTGRLSSSSGIEGIGFNNQNIPKGRIGALRNTRGELILDKDGIRPVFEGVNCKKLFLPDDDSYVFVNADAKGAEVSIFSAYARDEALIEALFEGMDAHSFFGSKCLNPEVVAEGLTGDSRRIALASAGIDEDHAWSYDDFLLGKDGLHPDKAYGKRLKKLRDNIKRLVFGLLYGAGYRKIADIAGINHQQAKKIQDLLFKMFPSIRTYMDRVKWELKMFRMAETYFGRRRRFPLNFGKNEDAPKKLLAQAERRLLNFSIQSTNSDIVLMVMCWVAEELRDLGGRMLLTVHDSLGFQIPKKYVNQVGELMTRLGTQRVAKVCPWLPVPYRWDTEVGPSYGEVIPLKQYLENLHPIPVAELDGYTHEDIKDNIRAITDDPLTRKVA